MKQIKKFHNNKSKRTDNQMKTDNLNGLSFSVIGCLFEVHNYLGNNYQEKYYQRAIAESFKDKKIQFEKEKCIPIRFKNKEVGKYYIDFVIEKKVVVETKTVPFLKKQDQNQTLSYMKELQMRLGILANFRSPKLTYKRLVLPDKYLQHH